MMTANPSLGFIDNPQHGYFRNLSLLTRSKNVGSSIVSALTDTTTTSASYILIPGTAPDDAMRIRPAKGRYVIFFSTSGIVNAGGVSKEGNVAIALNSSVISHTERSIRKPMGGTAFDTSIATNITRALSGLDIIEVYYKVESGASITLHERSLILVKIN